MVGGGDRLDPGLDQRGGENAGLAGDDDLGVGIAGKRAEINGGLSLRAHRSTPARAFFFLGRELNGTGRRAKFAGTLVAQRVDVRRPVRRDQAIELAAIGAVHFVEPDIAAQHAILVAAAARPTIRQLAFEPAIPTQFEPAINKTLFHYPTPSPISKVWSIGIDEPLHRLVISMSTGLTEFGINCTPANGVIGM